MIFNYLKQFKYIFSKRPYALEKPVVVQFPINDICNAGCQMCHIWKKKLQTQVSVEEVERIFKDELFEEVITVGINGGEPTLRKDLPEIANALFNVLPKLRTISLITNAINKKQVVNRIEELGRVVDSHGGKLDVMISLDGVGEVHDKVRGRKGNFLSVEYVLEELKKSKYINKLRLACTIIKDNVYGLHQLHNYADERNVYIKYRLGVPHQRLYTEDIKDPFSLTLEEKAHVAVFLENVIRHYEKSDQQKFFYRSLIDQIVHGMPRRAGCDWQHRGVTLTSRGELAYCAVESPILGSAIQESANGLYFNGQSHLQNILKNKCANCMHDYVGLPPKNILLRDYAKRLLSKFHIKTDWLKRNPLLRPVKRSLMKSRYKKREAYYLSLLEQKVIKTDGVPKKANHKNILICGWYGTETLGDKAILGGVLAAVKLVYPDANISLVTLERYISELTARQMKELNGVEIISVEDGIGIAAFVDMVVFGGGPLMALDNMAEMVAIFKSANYGHVPTVLAGCGVGPLGAHYHNEAIKELLTLSSIRIYRDRKSLKNASLMGIDTSNDKTAEDPAFSWIEENKNRDAKKSRPDSARLLLALRDWPYREYGYGINENEAIKIKTRYEQELKKALVKLGEKYTNLKLLPFPMCTNHIGSDDRWYYQKFFKDEPRLIALLDQEGLDRDLAPKDALRVYESADALIAMRFHSLVFGLGAGIPTLALDYTLGRGKVGALAERSNVTCFSLEDIDCEKIYKEIDTLLSAPEKTLVNQGLDKYRFIDYFSEAVKEL